MGIMVYWGQIRVAKPKFGANNDFINLIQFLVNFACALEEIMTRFGFLWVR